MFRHRDKIPESDHQPESGTYTCSKCGLALFQASKKFDVGSGFPSFWARLGEHVQHNPLHTYARHRIQLLCSRCQQHLGHLFDDARTPSQVRYCIHADALKFEE